MGIEPTSEIWVHAATSRARLYRNGRTKVVASVHCRPPQPSQVIRNTGLPMLQSEAFFLAKTQNVRHMSVFQNNRLIENTT